jgi:hypothetical protein
MWRWSKWVLAALMLTGIVIIGINCYKFFIGNRLTDKLNTKAEAAFASGIFIDDEKGDWASIGNKEEDKDKVARKINNPIAYTADYFDIKSMAAGIDEENIYFKLTFYGDIPKKAESFDGDKIIDVGMKFNIMDMKVRI